MISRRPSPVLSDVGEHYARVIVIGNIPSAGDRARRRGGGADRATILRSAGTWQVSAGPGGCQVLSLEVACDTLRGLSWRGPDSHAMDIVVPRSDPQAPPGIRWSR